MNKSKDRNKADESSQNNVPAHFLFASMGLNEKEDIIKYFENLAKKSTRLNIKSKFIHLSISFSPEDSKKMDPYKATSILRRTVQELYGKNVDFAVWDHTDKNYYHLHSIICKVKNNGEGCLIDTSFNNKRAIELCRKYEMEYGLKTVKNNPNGKRQDHKIVHAQIHQYKIQKADLWKKLDDIRSKSMSLTDYISSCKAQNIDVFLRRDSSGKEVGITYSIQSTSPLSKYSAEKATAAYQKDPNKLIFSGKNLGSDYMLKGLNLQFARNNESRRENQLEQIALITKSCITESRDFGDLLKVMRKNNLELSIRRGNPEFTLTVIRNGLQLELQSNYFTDQDRNDIKSIIRESLPVFQNHVGTRNGFQNIEYLDQLRRERLRREAEQEILEDIDRDLDIDHDQDDDQNRGLGHGLSL